MTSMNQGKKKPAYSPWSDPVFESMKGIGGGIGSGLTNDLGKGVAKGIGRSFGSFFGGGFSGESLDRQERPPYWAERKERIPKQTWYERQQKEVSVFTWSEYNGDQQVARQMKAIRQELKAIIEEMKALGQQVNEAEKAIEMKEVDPGKYHLGVLQRIRQILKLLRQQISESRSWLEMTYAKKRARKYWWMYKKHGTTFGLSHERVVATQAG